jgi:zinc transporter 2
MLVVLHPHSHGHSHSHSNSKETSLNDLSKENDSKIDEERRKSSGRLKWRPLKKHGLVDNINVRAAFIHVIGDLIQSIGVVIAGYIIWFKVGLLYFKDLVNYSDHK